MDQVQLVRELIRPPNLSFPMAGAMVSFEGRVRSVCGGKSVVRLKYEAYESLAVKELTDIVHEAQKKFSVLHLCIRHRLGWVEVGELAVWVGVWSVHRQSAFAACATVMDQLKSRVPIWKCEQYEDGSTTWVGCDASPGHQQVHAG